jgi:hypothetical protein
MIYIKWLTRMEEMTHNVVSEGFEVTTLVAIGTDYTRSCISNSHTITTATAPQQHFNYIVLPVSSTNKTDQHDITEILLKVRLNPITLTQ